MEERLVHQAVHDSLTGLANRGQFIQRLRHAMTNVAGRRRVGVLFIDLDDFKIINDSLGHTAGDQLLNTIGERLRRAIRPTDSVARVGGDEFTICCDHLRRPADATDLASRLLADIGRPIALAGGEVFVSASIGIALASRDDTPETLLRDADAAMYRAKQHGKARAEFFDEHDRARTLEHLDTHNALHRAIERHEFELYYQPLITLETGHLAGFEALLRWHHPERGLLKPDQFLHYAEDTGLIVPIGTWVFQTACQQLAAWHAQRRDKHAPLAMSINLSPRQLADPALAQQLTDILRATRARADSIWLEITETTLLYDTDSARSALDALRAQGLHLAIDDFGTGYSSLSHLRNLPIDNLKIDRSFIDGLGKDPDDTAIVTAVISLAHTLGYTATAEGVETPLQLAELRALGCDVAQGHLLARPQPAPFVNTDPDTHLDAWADFHFDRP
jgi:diguanylate cyclase (GGDEF)-like protein